MAALESHWTVTAEGCWDWSSVTGGGYGNAKRDGRQMHAHRYVYEALIGPIPAGLDLDHLCRNRRCVNPAHMEPVTRRENVLRGDTIAARNARKTHCHRGHEFTEANTYRRPDAPWRRECLACRRETDRRRRR